MRYTVLTTFNASYKVGIYGSSFAISFKEDISDFTPGTVLKSENNVEIFFDYFVTCHANDREPWKFPRNAGCFRILTNRAIDYLAENEYEYGATFKIK